MKHAVVKNIWQRLGNSHVILDIGCGTGDFGRYKPEKRVVYGIDFDLNLLRIAKSSLNPIYFDLDQETRLPFTDHFFDSVVTKDILEHLQKPWQLLKEVKRVIKPGGVIFASLICFRSRQVWKDYTHVRGYTPTSARSMFQDAGFTDIILWRMGGIPLTSRLHLLSIIPYLLMIPPLDWLFTTGYELTAKAPEQSIK